MVMWIAASGKVWFATTSLVMFINSIFKAKGGTMELEYLNLSHAGFDGKIPHNIGNLSNLKSLALGDNFPGLNVDSLEWVRGLSELEQLNMNGVNMSKATNCDLRQEKRKLKLELARLRMRLNDLEKEHVLFIAAIALLAPFIPTATEVWANIAQTNTSGSVGHFSLTLPNCLY